MDIWEVFGLVLFGFPPTAILFIASLIKLFAVLEETTISWSKAFAWATMTSIVLFFGIMLFYV